MLKGLEGMLSIKEGDLTAYFNTFQYLLDI